MDTTAVFTGTAGDEARRFARKRPYMLFSIYFYCG